MRLIACSRFADIASRARVVPLKPAAWVALAAGRRALLAGDHRQLPPTILSDEAAREGLAVTLMERLVEGAHGAAMTRMLQTQYRMHQLIMEVWGDNEGCGVERRAHR